MSYLRDAVAGEVRAHLARQKKTGVELAALLDLTQQSVSRRLNAEVDMSLDELVTIAEWLAVSVADLLPTTPHAA